MTTLRSKGSTCSPLLAPTTIRQVTVLAVLVLAVWCGHVLASSTSASHTTHAYIGARANSSSSLIAHHHHRHFPYSSPPSNISSWKQSKRLPLLVLESTRGNHQPHKTYFAEESSVGGDGEDEDEDSGALALSSSSSTELPRVGQNVNRRRRIERNDDDVSSVDEDDFCSHNYVDSAYYNGYDTILTRGDRLWYYYRDEHRISKAFDQRRFTQGRCFRSVQSTMGLHCSTSIDVSAFVCCLHPVVICGQSARQSIGGRPPVRKHTRLSSLICMSKLT